MNWKFKRTAFIWNGNLVTFDQFSVSSQLSLC